MRMDDRKGESALELVAELEELELARIFRLYGEESQAGRIARAIVRERTREPIETTTRLAEVIEKSVPATLRAKIHPATRVFQALRIAVNDELGVLESALPEAFRRLKPGGRLSVLTYHSLEDRLVKTSFAEWVGRCTCPRDFPYCLCGAQALGRIVHRKPVVASEAELQTNPRARSAKLRTIERLDVA
jgi:16S rRNA (cytosine1402-N4)-methyltransferase